MPTTVFNVMEISVVGPDMVYVGRKMPGQEYRTGPTDGRWGNPFVMNEHGSAVGAMFARWLLESYEFKAIQMRANIMQLKDKALGCWCVSKSKPWRKCHAMVLAALADGDTATLEAAKRVEWWTEGRKDPQLKLL